MGSSFNTSQHAVNDGSQKYTGPISGIYTSSTIFPNSNLISVKAMRRLIHQCWKSFSEKASSKGLKDGLYTMKQPNFISIDFIDEGCGMNQVMAVNKRYHSKAEKKKFFESQSTKGAR